MTAAPQQVVPERISAARDALTGPRSGIDDIFVAAGRELIASVESLRRVTRLFGSIPSTLESDDLRQAVGMIGDVSRRTAAMAHDITGDSGELGQLMEALSKASNPIDQLLRVMKTMGIVSINARVAAAGLGSSSVDFGIFWEDLGQLAKSANSVVSKIAQQYEALARSLASASLARTRFLASQRQPLRLISHSLHERLQSIEELRRQALTSSVQIEESTRSITDRVAAIIASMQSGDATRQRMDHIDEALGKLTEEALPENVVSLTVVLQSRQLAAAREEFDRDTSAAMESVTGILNDLRGLQQRAGVVGLGGGKNSALDALEEAVRQSANALHRCELDRQTLDGMAQNVVSTVGELLVLATELEGLERQTRLVSLNATIRCSHLGDRGRALTVVAQQLRELTEETAASSAAAVAALRRAAELSAQTAADGAGKPTIATGQLEAEINGALGVLVRLGQSVTEANAELQRETPLVRNRLSNVLKLLGNCKELILHMDDAADALAIDSQADDEGGFEGSESHSAFFANLRKSYSVEAERQIHDALVQVESAPDPSPSTDGDELEAMLF